MKSSTLPPGRVRIETLMEIYLCDGGPLRSVVHIIVDGEKIAFPETSYPKLLLLLTALGATRESFSPSESNWTFELDTVRESVLHRELEEVKAALAWECKLRQNLEMQTAEPIIDFQCQQQIEKLPDRLSLWRRFWWVILRR